MNNTLAHSSSPFLTIALALAFGIFFKIIAKKINVSSIVVLLIGGVIIGPEFLNLIQPHNLGEGLNLILLFCVSIILFEGGLTLNYSGYKKAEKTIWSILSLGAMITWVIVSLSIYWLFNFPLSFCFLAGSLIIVTGPTVIIPLLRRINLKPKLAHIFHWEGVLIDPIGVFIAVLMFELISSETQLNNGHINYAFLTFLKQILVGIIGGGISGFGAYKLLKKNWIPQDLINPFMFMLVWLTFGLCDFFAHESGILGVIVSGFVIGLNNKKLHLEKIKQFKQSLTDIAIGLIFILLSANLSLEKIKQFGYNGLLLILIVLFIARLIAIFVSTIGTKELKFKEKLFLSWVAPRGIIAASMATLFSLNLSNNAHLSEYAWFIEIFTFMVIAGSILLQGLPANLFAKILDLKEKKDPNWVIVGMHYFSEKIYHYLIQNKQNVIIIDNNKNIVKQYAKKGINVICKNSLDEDIAEAEAFLNVGNLLAITDNLELNILIAQHWAQIIPKNNIYYWSNHKSTTQKQNFLGKAIWEDLPKPSIISTELQNKSSTLAEKQIAKQNEEQEIDLDQRQIFNNSENIYPILYWNKQNQLKPTYSNHLNSFATNREIQVLFIKRNINSIFNQITKDNVFLMNNGSFKTIYKKMINKCVEKNSVLSPNHIIDEITSQQKSVSFVLSNKAAIGRYYSSKVASPLVYFTSIKKPITPAKTPFSINIAFLLIIPKNDYNQYLNLLSNIDKLLHQNKIYQELLNSQNREQILNSLKKFKFS